LIRALKRVAMESGVCKADRYYLGLKPLIVMLGFIIDSHVLKRVAMGGWSLQSRPILFGAEAPDVEAETDGCRHTQE
jgi:hypothetical protein